MYTQSIFKYFIEILNSLPDGIFISDKNGMGLFSNSIYDKITGLKGAELVGQNVQNLLDKEIFDKVVNPIVIETKQAQTYVQKTKNGKHLILSGTPVFDKDGEICLVVTFVRDISTLSAMNEQIEEQANLIQDFHDQMLLVSQQNINEVENVFARKSIKKTIKNIDQIAKTDATILILGETGVGKDVCAKYIHSKSERNDMIFFKVDCGAISENLIESEMFGYMHGAFTGASSKGKSGYFELAAGGTIFLDEIGELPLSTQTRLLRVLQDGEIMRIGDNSPRKINVRIIAATNKNLLECVYNGTFRSDLYYRLNVATIHIPPLSERKRDIVSIANHYLKIYTMKYNKKIEFAEDTLETFKRYHWPGNIRELQNIIHSIVITHDTQLITPKDLPKNFNAVNIKEKKYASQVTGNGQSLKEIMADMEYEFIKEAVEHHGSIKEVSRIFKVDRTTISRKYNLYKKF